MQLKHICFDVHFHKITKTRNANMFSITSALGCFCQWKSSG